MDPYLAEIRSFGGNFAPRGWMFCNGALLSIAQNTALFSLIGTIYGGDGQTTFGLPNLNSRVPVGTGQGPGLSNIDLGEMAGTETVTLLSTQIPQHNHAATAPAAGTSNTAAPSASVAPGPASLGAGVSNSFGAATGNLAPPTLGVTGGSQPHNNLQPFLGLNYIICVEGIYPSRN